MTALAGHFRFRQKSRSVARKRRLQHPLEPPAMLVRFAEPPSVVGIAGGQTGEDGPAVAAVDAADCLDVAGISPGNCNGTCEAFDEGVLIPAVLPPAASGLVPPFWEPPEGEADAGRID